MRIQYNSKPHYSPPEYWVIMDESTDPPFPLEIERLILETTAEHDIPFARNVLVLLNKRTRIWFVQSTSITASVRLTNFKIAFYILPH